MIRLCAHSFGCLNLIGWVYKWEYIPNLIWDDSWWCELWISRCPTWSPLEQMETPRWQPSIRAGPTTCNEELDSFFASYIFAVLHLFFGQGQHPINARMQTILSIKFVVVFEIALTWWVMTPFLPLFMLLCLWQVNGSDTAIHSNKIKAKTQTKKIKHWSDKTSSPQK